MDDPREEFLKGVDFDKLEINEYPQIAFLCGGSPEILTDDDSIKQSIRKHLPSLKKFLPSPKQYFPSVRSYFSHQLYVRHSSLLCQNAEDIKDWNSYSAYEDLIEFEKDIAHICKAIVLFVESPGSIAELGTFAIIPEITKKLIIFVHSDYSNATSFVSLGPLKRIENDKIGKIHFISWSMEERILNGENRSVLRIDSINKWDKYTCDAIKTFAESKFVIDHSSQEYTRTKETLFIHDLAILFKAITEDEIYDFFKHIGHNIERKKIQRSLFCLEKLDLIFIVNSGNKTYFIPDNDSLTRYLKLPLGKDTVRLAMQVSKYYEHHSQLTRREAISSVLGGGR